MFHRLKDSNWLRYVVTLMIGGLLVALGYLIGNSDPSVEAQDSITRFETITCKGLTIFDGNPEHGSIWLGIDEEHPVLILSDHADFSKSEMQIQINVGYDPKYNTEAAVLKLLNRKSSIGLFAGTDETAVINLNTEKLMIPGISLIAGTEGSGIMLEGDWIQAKTR